MSKVVKKFPVNPRAKYDWSKWADGKIHQCLKGTDFATEAKAFSMTARKYAERHNLKLESRIEGDSVYIKFVNPAKLKKVRKV